MDLYLCNDKIYIGELTFSHFAGFTKFEPKEYETILGNYIKIGGKRNEKNSIVFIMSSLGFGGAERVVSSLCNWIVNNTEDNVSIIKFDNKDNAYELDKRINVVSMINNKKK